MTKKIKKISEDTVFIKKTKLYRLEINNKIIEVEKWWIDVKISDVFDCDWEIISIKNKETNDDEKLLDDELEEIGNFVNKLN